MALVNRSPTPVSDLDRFDQIEAALVARGVAPITWPMLQGLNALVALENGHGAAILNHNWGNLMAGASWRNSGADFWAHPDPQPGQPEFFRAYPNHVAGAQGWIGVLQRQHPDALEQARRGAFRELGLSLFRSGYVAPSFPGHHETYSDELEQIALKFERDGVPDRTVSWHAGHRAGGAAEPGAGDPNRALLAALATVAGATAAGYMLWRDRR